MKNQADIVNIVNTNSKDICLAIGDGGNDVNMIQAASIGVGIEGKEGKQVFQQCCCGEFVGCSCC